MSSPFWLLAALSVFVVASPASAQPPAGPADPALARVPADSVVFISLKVSKIWDNPAAKPLHDWFNAQKDAPLDLFFGVAPAELDRITALAATSMPHSNQPFVLVTTRKPYDKARVLKALGVTSRQRADKEDVGPAVWTPGGIHEAVAFLDDRSMMFLRDPQLPLDVVARLIGRRADGPLADALMEARAHDFTLGVDVSGLIRARERATFQRLDPQESAPYRSLLKARSATLTADFERAAKVRLSMSFPDAETAKAAEPELKKWIAHLPDLIGDLKESPVPLTLIAARWMLNFDANESLPRIAANWEIGVLKTAKVTAMGATVLAESEVPYAEELAKAVAALPRALDATRRGTVAATGHLRDLAFAMHDYESSIGEFPPEIIGGAAAKPGWSWRVQILPYIGQEDLYRQLDLMKSWNDPKNLKVLEAVEMPKLFEHPGRPAPKGHTYFRIFSLPRNAKGTDRPFYQEGERGPKLQSVTDGSSRSIMIVEAGEAVQWYKPDVLPYDGKLPLPPLGDKARDSFLAAFVDGSVRSLRPSLLGEKTLRALITINGSEKVELSK